MTTRIERIKHMEGNLRDMEFIQDQLSQLARVNDLEEFFRLVCAGAGFALGKLVQEVDERRTELAEMKADR